MLVWTAFAPSWASQLDIGATISAPHMHAMTLELLEEHLATGKRALDVGCGRYLARALARAVFIRWRLQWLFDSLFVRDGRGRRASLLALSTSRRWPSWVATICATMASAPISTCGHGDGWQGAPDL